MFKVNNSDFLTSELTVSPLSQRILMANLMSKPIQFVDSDMFQFLS